MKKALTIAGSDSGGGAGIQADLKTFSAHGVFGMSVITAITAQNTMGVLAVQDVWPEMIAKQMEAIFEDMGAEVVKVGMVSQPETIRVIAAGLRKYAPPLIVVDPVMVSKSGYHLLQPEAEAILIAELLPLATLVTPNIPEAEVLADGSQAISQLLVRAAVLYEVDDVVLHIPSSLRASPNVFFFACPFMAFSSIAFRLFGVRPSSRQ